MKQRKYFDVNCTIGRKSKPDEDFPYLEKDLLDDMRYSRVHGAAVSSNESIDYCFISGDRKLAEITGTGKGGRLYGVATLPATAVFESGDPEYLNKLFAAGIRGIRIAPSRFVCGSDPRDMEEIAEALIRRNLPLFYPSNEGFERLIPLLDAYKKLNVILLSSSWGTNRQLFPLLERYPALHFEYSKNQANDVLELTKKHFGIERVLFGTGWPYTSMAALKSLNEYAALSDEDKDAAAYKNACRLLKIDPDELTAYDDADCQYDDIAKAADAGKPMPVPVIDAHTHMVPREHKTTSGVLMLNSSPEHMAEKFSRMGVKTALTAPWEGICTDGMAGNEQILYAAKKFPGMFLGYNTCNVNYADDLSGWRGYFDKYPGVFAGIKPYWPYQQFSLLNDSLRPWLEYADERGLLLLLHASSPERNGEAAELSERYKGITFILAHAGAEYRTAREHVKLIKARKNVVAEITFTSLTRGVMEYLVNEIGAEKVLYGSDAPMRDPSPQLGWVAYAKISYEDKCKILYKNIERLMSLNKNKK